MYYVNKIRVYHSYCIQILKPENHISVRFVWDLQVQFQTPRISFRMCVCGGGGGGGLDSFRQIKILDSTISKIMFPWVIEHQTKYVILQTYY